TIVPIAAYAPVSHSPIWPPTEIGARSIDPRPSPTIPPDHACNVNSVAARSLHGPSSPKGVIAVTVVFGAARRIAAGARAGCSAMREPRGHTTAAGPATRAGP